MREAQGALFNTSPVLGITGAMVREVKERCVDSVLGRFRICLHHTTLDAVQEMVIAVRRGSYMQPHCHPGRSTSLLVLEGTLDVHLFDDQGSRLRTTTLNPYPQGTPFCLRLEAGVWHMPMCRSDVCVFYETLQGPFLQDESNLWAPWSPPDEDVAAVQALMHRMEMIREA